MAQSHSFFIFATDGLLAVTSLSNFGTCHHLKKVCFGPKTRTFFGDTFNPSSIKQGHQGVYVICEIASPGPLRKSDAQEWFGGLCHPCEVEPQRVSALEANKSKEEQQSRESRRKSSGVQKWSERRS